VATAARVASEHAGAAHRPSSHWSRGWITDDPVTVVATVMSPGRFKQVAAAEFASTPSKEAWHCADRPERPMMVAVSCAVTRLAKARQNKTTAEANILYSSNEANEKLKECAKKRRKL